MKEKAAGAVVDTTLIDALTEGMRRELGTRRRKGENVTHCSPNQRRDAASTRKRVVAAPNVYYHTLFGDKGKSNLQAYQGEQDREDGSE